MKTLIAKDVVEMVQAAAEKDSRADTATVGWACLGAVSCAYYPRSERHNWFIADKGVSNKRDVINWVSKQLLPTSYTPSRQTA